MSDRGAARSISRPKPTEPFISIPSTRTGLNLIKAVMINKFTSLKVYRIVIILPDIPPKKADPTISRGLPKIFAYCLMSSTSGSRGIPNNGINLSSPVSVSRSIDTTAIHER